MSKHAKALAKLGAAAPSADLKWEELKALLEHLGYTMLKGSGSRRKFYHRERDALIVCHRPHSSATVDKGCVADVAAHLKAHGFIRED